MMRFLRRLTAIALAMTTPAAGQFHFPGSGSSGASNPKTPAAETKSTEAKAPDRTAPAEAVPFDSYVMALGWSPNFCALPGNAAAHPKECAVGSGIRFVVRSLSPGSAAGAELSCGGSGRAPSRVLIASVLPLMISEAAVRAEWAKHGVCTGLRAADYFTDLRHARSEVQIPVQMTSLDDTVTETPEQIEAQFAGANPGFPEGAFRVACQDGALTEVRVCFDRLIKARECPTVARQCAQAELTVRAPR